MKKNLFLIAILSLFLLACNKKSESSVSRYTHAEDDHITYICPMDCEDGKTYDKEGDCPVCGMALDESEEEED